MIEIETVWRIFLAVSAIAIGSATFRAKGNAWGIALLYAVHIGAATLLALSAALGRLPW